MLDLKNADDTDNSILEEIIAMCENHMGGGLKKPEPELEISVEPEAKEAEEHSEGAESGMEGKDLDELMEMYKSLKG